MEKEMLTQNDTIQQLIRIMGWVLAPLLIKYGVDEANAMVITAGAGTLAGLAVWWVYWQFFGRTQ